MLEILLKVEQVVDAVLEQYHRALEKLRILMCMQEPQDLLRCFVADPEQHCDDQRGHLL